MLVIEAGGPGAVVPCQQVAGSSLYAPATLTIDCLMQCDSALGTVTVRGGDALPR